MSKADTIEHLINQASPRVAVVFSGDVPRIIGTLDAAPTARAVKGPVDAMLMQQHLSATFISLGTCPQPSSALASAVGNSSSVAAHS